MSAFDVGVSLGISNRSYDMTGCHHRCLERQGILSDQALYPMACPTMDQALGMQNYYNDCLGSIDQLRHGCSFPDLTSMMMGNPQTMMLFLMIQQIQMQNTLLMMSLIGGQGGANTSNLSSLLSNGSCGNNYGSSYENYSNGPSGSIGSSSGGKVSDVNKQQAEALLENAAQKYGIPPNVLKSIAWQESKWNSNAVGDGGKSFGMMQIYTSAHPDYDVARGKADISYNIDYGAKLLRSLYDRYGSWEKAVERYNGSGPMAQRYASNVMNHTNNEPWLA